MKLCNSPPPQPIFGRVLIVDDEKNIAKTFRFCLEDNGHRVASAATANEAKTLVQQDVFDVCFLDLRLGDDSGLDLIPELHSLAPWMKIVMITAFSSIDSAIEAVRRGASDYLAKPCTPEQLRIAVRQQLELRQLESRLARLEHSAGDPSSNNDRGDSVLNSASPVMMQVLETVRGVADTDATILIRGESGTGKGAIARAIHQLSSRQHQDMVVINCPSLSAELLESELFGHKKGAFTGATETTQGRVSQAEGGSLFLDEIGDFPLALQPKLLRFIQDREYERIGDPTTRRADVRLIAATNRDLNAMVSASEFREDLLYRLNVITIELPPLRDRPEDTINLAEQFLAKYARAYSRPARYFDIPAKQQLRDYGWPGNVRELQNVVERAAILCRGEAIQVQDLNIDQHSAAETQGRLRAGDPVTLAQLEQAHIGAIVASNETLELAAQTLGIDPSTLWRKRKQYGI